MRNGIGFVGAAALVLLAGCGGGQSVDSVTVNAGAANVAAPADNGAVGNSAVPASAATLQLAGDGINLVSASGTQQVAFNTSREAVVAAVVPALGNPADQGTNTECGEGPLDNVDYGGGLTLFFQSGKFVGWDIDGRDGSPHKTTGGIGIGSTLQQLRDAGDVAVQDTSLGVEFTAGDISGLVTVNRPDGKITNLWSGMTCIFR